MSRHTEDGATYRKVRKRFLEDNPVCWLCHHDGANQVDHNIPRSHRYGRMETWNWRPAHGPPGCPTCGKCCNQVRGNRPAPAEQPAWVSSPDW